MTIWRTLTIVVDSGEFRPGQMRATKPAHERDCLRSRNEARTKHLIRKRLRNRCCKPAEKSRKERRE